MAKNSSLLNPITGFPEWLPNERMLEQRFLETIRLTFERFGFTSIETPAVERNETLLSKGEIEKQIYALYRPNVPDDVEPDTGLSLHFDLTVPLARYVAQHYGKLVFPFRRYQIQKVWRGERAQRGRFREFYQCDIDIVGDGSLDFLADAEMTLVIYELFNDLNLGPFCIHFSNRKILQGIMEQFEVQEERAAETLRAVDRLPKLKGGWNELADWLVKELALPTQLLDVLQDLFACDEPVALREEALARLAGIGIDHPLFQQGCKELELVMSYMDYLKLPQEEIRIDLSITRGLDYYTGTVFETFLHGHEKTLGSVCSGGRYENLVSHFVDRQLPGVGVSIGLSRLFSHLLESGVVQAEAATPAEVMVTVPDRERLHDALGIANLLRNEGLNVELFVQEARHDKQLKIAVRKGIPFAVIPWPDRIDEQDSVELRNLIDGDREVVLRHEVAGVIRFVLEKLGYSHRLPTRAY